MIVLNSVEAADSCKRTSVLSSTHPFQGLSKRNDHTYRYSGAHGTSKPRNWTRCSVGFLSSRYLLIVPDEFAYCQHPDMLAWSHVGGKVDKVLRPIPLNHSCWVSQ